MPTIRPRCTITFEDEELRDKIDSFRFDNRYRSQNDAIMALINKGIEIMLGEEQSKPKEEISPEDKRILRAYHAADDGAKYYALQMLENNTVKKTNRA